MTYYSDFYTIDKEAKYKHYWKYFEDVNGPILDIGCTTGNFIQWRSNNILGIDRDYRALTTAHQRGFAVCQSNIEQGLSFPTGSFAGVNCSAVLEHVSNPLYLMYEIRRVLQVGGKAVILVPDVRRYRFNYWIDYTHKTPFTKQGLARIAVDGGFTDFKIGRYVFNYLKYLPGARHPKIRRYVDQLERLLASVISKDLILVAYK